jgi:Fatty acid desaturase
MNFQRTLEAFLIVTILSAIVAVKLSSVLVSVFAGVFLGLLTLAAHNFLHQKDSWRMYCFNLSGLNYREWRVSHIMSHHMYPNSLLDFEVFRFEPFVKWLPREKSFADNMASVVFLPLLWLSLPTVLMMQR